MYQFHPPPQQPSRGQGTALVVGGTGYLGRAVCTALRDHGYDVVALGRRVTRPPEGCDLRVADVLALSVPELTDFLDALEPRVVVNAAGALWNVTEADMARSNHELVGRLVDALAAGRHRARLVQLGSVYEYGAQPGGYLLLNEKLTEHPTTQYARTKLAGTRTVVAAAAEGRISATVLRVSTVLGPLAPPGSLFGQIAEQLLRGTGVLELPELAGERDFVDLRDVTQAVAAAARNSAAPPLINIAAGRLTSVRRLVDTLVKISGMHVTYRSRAAGTVRRDADIGSQYIDIRTARTALRWIPRHTAYEALTSLWRSVTETPAPLIREPHRKLASNGGVGRG